MSENKSSLPSSNLDAIDSVAADVIRDKVARIYAEEPDAKKEMQESTASHHRSKHQEYMYKLSMSGKDLASIQTEWHNYYQSLPSDEKHQVWHEFYASQSSVTGQPTAQQVAAHKHQASVPISKKKQDTRKPEQIRNTIRDKVTAGGKLETKHHLQSLLFGLGVGSIVLVIFLFSFFNEVVIAPFIQPSRTAASTPLILNSESSIATATPEVIIPKINVEIPTDFSVSSTNEGDIENALDKGIVHYPTTALPGEVGNTSFFGHSSNNIFNKGKYKFAFVLLHTLEKGDTFYLTYNSKTYVYKIFDKKVVDPSEVGVLNPVPGHSTTATLITCDPPGTSLKRLVVIGDQISPEPSTNTQSATSTTTETPVSQASISSLPGNGKTFGGRYLQSVWSKVVLALILSVTTLYVMQKVGSALKRKK